MNILGRWRSIVAIRGERGSYNQDASGVALATIVAIRGERGSYNDFEAGRKNRPPPFEIGALTRAPIDKR